MPVARPDGAASSIEPTANAWESVFAEGRELGDTVLTSAADLGDGTPQSGSEGLSDGAGNGSPTTPQTDTTGDGGRIAEPAGSTAPAPGTTADASAAPTDVDPLAGAEPFTYTVDGQTRAMEGAYRLPGDGVYIPEDRVPAFQLIASRAETLDRQNRELYDRSQSLERLGTWQRQTGQDAQGKPIYETLTGAAGNEALRVSHAELLAQNIAYAALFKNPNQMADLLVAVRDAAGAVTHFEVDPDKYDNFQTRQKLATRDMVDSVRKYVGTLGVAPPPPEPTLAAIAVPTVDATIKALNVTGLTDADRTYLVGQIKQYVRASTPEERQRGHGPRVVDDSFGDVVKDRAAMRAEILKTATVSGKTDQFNGGMNRGRQGNAAPRPPAAPPQPLPTGRNAPRAKTEASANDMWANLVEEARHVG